MKPIFQWRLPVKKEDLFVANNKSRQVIHFGQDGSVLDKISYKQLGVVTVTAIAVDGSVFLVADSRFNKVVMSSFDGAEINVVAYGNENYGGNKLNNPSGIAADEGTYYIVDSGNKRVLVFEGASFRRTFGEENLLKPVSVCVNHDLDEVYVTDLVKGSILKFASGGQFEEEIKLDDQPTPSYIYRDTDGFYYIADFNKNSVAKYDQDLKLITMTAEDLQTPRGLALLGLGPDATMYVATKDKVTTLKGGWDNLYVPK